MSEDLWRKDIKIGRYQNKTLLLAVYDHGAGTKLRVGWSNTKAFTKLHPRMQARYDKWYHPPNEVLACMRMWFESEFRWSTSPIDFFVKTMGIRPHWTEW